MVELVTYVMVTYLSSQCRKDFISSCVDMEEKSSFIVTLVLEKKIIEYNDHIVIENRRTHSKDVN
ncbi:hypothetical protein DERF_004770 [Dermatophagoides farinae]|uniref:Uncharacterized protein n=1 Tax=Dermatophagoides farinae TaxID=6954 RepID=A0A922L5X0_DERFA|nr:hypothetical protein DERF_004770 [Dermatophagoides farinae]